MDESPTHLDLDRERGLTVLWADGTRHFLPIALLRAQSPSAEMKALRKEMASNPLTVLPSSGARAGSRGPLMAEGAELVGNYAIRIRFSDGHDTGIYSWRYLRELGDAAPPTVREGA